MNELNLIHNRHWTGGLRAFRDNDPHLSRRSGQPLQYVPPLLEQIPDVAGVYTVAGGRQIGKTTSLKLLMEKWLSEGVSAESIFFLTGELIDDHHVLVREVREFLRQAPLPAVVIVDEVTYIRDWDKGVKFLADAGLLAKVRFIVTGSDLLLIQEARSRFPGRRGESAAVDFHIRPLTFAEFISLWGGPPSVELFEQYLVHGGFITAINDFRKNGRIGAATLRTYSDWIRGDVLKKGRSEAHLRSVLESLILRQGTQVSWNSLARDLTIDHPKTVSEYVELLERLDVVNIVSALDEETLHGAPKKAKKIYFADPFIGHALKSWLSDITELPALSPEEKGIWAEAITHQHLRRTGPSYYIKSEGEVDAVRFLRPAKGPRFQPIEVKWTTQIRTKDLKQIRKYPNGVIWGRYADPAAAPPVTELFDELMKF
jgi:predicted AAA+ superfamily ATPase